MKSSSSCREISMNLRSDGKNGGGMEGKQNIEKVENRRGEKVG
jgi:hypothetical protein